jgi:hypothetical protein
VFEVIHFKEESDLTKLLEKNPTQEPFVIQGGQYIYIYIYTYMYVYIYIYT